MKNHARFATNKSIKGTHPKGILRNPKHTKKAFMLQTPECVTTESDFPKEITTHSKRLVAKETGI